MKNSFSHHSNSGIEKIPKYIVYLQTAAMCESAFSAMPQFLKQCFVSVPSHNLSMPWCSVHIYSNNLEWTELLVTKSVDWLTQKTDRSANLGNRVAETSENIKNGGGGNSNPPPKICCLYLCSSFTHYSVSQLQVDGGGVAAIEVAKEMGEQPHELPWQQRGWGEGLLRHCCGQGSEVAGGGGAIIITADVTKLVGKLPQLPH